MDERERLMAMTKAKLQAFAERHGERVLSTPNNPISLGLTIGSFEYPGKGYSYIGAMLNAR